MKVKVNVNDRIMLLIGVVWVLSALAPASADAPIPPLKDYVFPIKASDNGRYLVDQAGTPFLYNANTTWHLINAKSLSEAQNLIDFSASHGVTVIQAMLLPWPGAGWDGYTSHGWPFHNNSFYQPNESYWQHVDAVVNYAATKGVVMCLGMMWTGCCGEGWHSIMTSKSWDENYAYGQFVANRYKYAANVMYFHGGDSGGGGDRVDAQGQGIDSVEDAPGYDGYRHMQTRHAAAGTSSSEMHSHAAWLDLTWTYEYWPSYNNLGKWPWEENLKEYDRVPPTVSKIRPFVIGEAGYVGHSHSNPQISRRQAYWTIFCGGSGHAMGNQPVWHCGRYGENWTDVYQGGTGGISTAHGKDMRSLWQVWTILSDLDWHELVPDDRVSGHVTVVTSGRGTGGDYVAAARATDGELIVAYIPNNRTVTIDMSKLSGPATAYWANPFNGETAVIADSLNNPLVNSGTYAFSTPGANGSKTGGGGDEFDWVLVLKAPEMCRPTLVSVDPCPQGSVPAYVNLVWDDCADNEDGYRVQRKPYGGNDTWTDIAQLAPDTTTYLDTDLLHGLVEYTYRVGAYRN